MARKYEKEIEEEYRNVLFLLFKIDHKKIKNRTTHIKSLPEFQVETGNFYKKV